MKILMVTNTYLPHVGGVARSVQSFTDMYRRLGHEVLVIAPQFEGAPAEEPGVQRVPAIQSFNDSDFSLPLTLPGMLAARLDEFAPDLVHSHHPFLLGTTALRISAARSVPIVFTHHTRYETYTHYLPIDTALVQRFVVELAIGYCNLCDAVIAPSESMRAMLVEGGVEAPIEVIPTGIDLNQFSGGDGQRVRDEFQIPADAFVVGHVGRLAPEKNLGFLARAVAEFLAQRIDAHFLIVGRGPCEEEIAQAMGSAGVANRVHFAGPRQGDDLASAYCAMDVFAFSSQSETQGMVLAEAMAAGLPVVAVDASGVRDLVEDRVNGRLLPHEDVRSFAAALQWIATRSYREGLALRRAVEQTAENFSLQHCANHALELYRRVIVTGRRDATLDDSWPMALRWLEKELKIVSSVMGAIGEAVRGGVSGE
ncbi:MAG TPA: glycosyltransferase [Pirellulales bacterium]|nr:glycosyltransferase [Pirellulales bacterium]